jgi:hypothetical protein
MLYVPRSPLFGLVVWFAVLAATSACRVTPAPAHNASLETLAPESVLAFAVQARRSLSSFEARVSVHTTGFQQSGSFDGLLRFRFPDSIRLRAYRQIGPTVFDFSMLGDRACLLLPAERRFLKGSIKGHEPSMDAVGGALFAQIFIWTRPPDPDCRPRVLWAREERACISYERNGQACRLTTIEVLHDTPVVVEEEIRDASDAPVLRASFSDFISCSSMSFPTRVEIVGTGVSSTFRILTVAADVRLNLPLADSDFGIEIPEGYMVEEDGF